MQPQRLLIQHNPTQAPSNPHNQQHDAVLDYYGRRLATCSSDKTIKIFEVEGESHKLVETLKGYVCTALGLACAFFSSSGKLTPKTTDTKARYGVSPGYVYAPTISSPSLQRNATQCIASHQHNNPLTIPHSPGAP